MHLDDLERVVDRALRRLPMPRAPQTLLPRIMTAVRHSASRSPYARSWFAWPLGWQVVSATTLVLLLAGLWMVLPTAPSLAATVVSALVGGPVGRVVDYLQDAAAMSSAARVVLRAVLEPLVWFVLPLMLLMCAACAAFGAALSRVALGGATQ